MTTSATAFGRVLKLQATGGEKPDQYKIAKTLTVKRPHRIAKLNYEILLDIDAKEINVQMEGVRPYYNRVLSVENCL